MPQGLDKQQTVLVKKPDGTTERVALVSLLERQTAKDQKLGTKALTTTTPVAKVFIDQAKASAWDAEDHKSPLEEKIDLKHDASRLLPDDRGDDTAKVIRRSGVSVDPSLVPRLCSMIQSRIKDIRTDDQVFAALHRSIEQGGIGCTAQEAEAIVISIAEVFHPKRSESRIKKALVPLLAKSLPSVSKAPPRSIPPVRPFSSGAKPVLHDVRPPVSQCDEEKEVFQSVGPVEEIRRMTLEHLRKLGRTEEGRRETLRAKFERLQEEDILGFFEAEEAWYQSPVYRGYQEILRASLKQARPLFAVAKERGANEEEMRLIVGT